MPDIIVGNGDTLTTTQGLAAGFNAIVAQGGTIAVASGDGFFTSGSNRIVVSGEIIAGGSGNPIFLTGNSSTVHVTSTGRVNAFSSGNSAILVLSDSAMTIANDGFIGNATGPAMTLDEGNDIVINNGTLRGNSNLGGGNDTFTQQQGGNSIGTVRGEDGNDTLRIEGVGTNASLLRFDGGNGTDIVDFTNFAGAVWVDLDYSGAEAWTRDDQNLGSSNAWRALADLANVETIVGSRNSDYLSGNAGDNTFGLSAGHDQIYGDGGTDTFDASSFTSGIYVNLGAGYGTEVWTQDRSGVYQADGVWREVADLNSIENIVSTQFDDIIIGDDADNTIVFIGTAGQHHIDSFYGGGGSDTVDFSRYGAAVWVDLTNPVVEAWTQFSGAVNLAQPWYEIADLISIENLTGSTLSDYFAGDANGNVLEGGRNADTLWGRGGADTFVFNLSSSELQTSAERDTIGDFVAGTDDIGISGLSNLPTIVIGAAPTATTGDDTLLYNTTTGVLSYDADGNGGGAAVEIAVLSTIPTLTTNDFVLLS
jgi:hypothetical protein